MVDAPECGAGGLATLALVLSSGERLCAEELRALAPDAPLVVLSACASAGGRDVDAEGLVGLARVFAEAGTRDLLVTLWPVEDRAARDFGLAYHRALLDGLPPALAARAGRRALAAAGHPLAERAAFRAMGAD